MNLTVVIPTCDRPEQLSAALASVRAQTRPPDEVLVVDDGERPARLSDVRIVRTGPRSGGAAARNAGAREARGDWLAFLDDDDTWAPEYLAEACALADEDADMVLTAFLKVRPTGATEPEKVPPAQLRVEDLYVANQGLRGSNLFIRRDVLLDIGGFDEGLPSFHDMDLALRLARRGVRLRRNVEPRVRFHVHDGPRLSVAGSPANLRGMRGFLARHGHAMGPERVDAFRDRSQRLFGVDPGPPPQVVWVLGPPGAGKSTWAERTAGPAGGRVLELTSLLGWLDGADVGVLTAKRHLVAAIRAVELAQEGNRRPLFVVSAFLEPEDLGALDAREHVEVVLPDEGEWRRRLAERDQHVSTEAEANYRRWRVRSDRAPSAAARCTARPADPTAFRWWSPGEVLQTLPIDRPVLESWDAAGSASQQRLAAFLATLAPADAVVEALTEPGWLDLDVVLPPSHDLLSGSDLENFLTPVVRRFDARRFVLVTGRKRLATVPGERSTLRIGMARPGASPAEVVAMRVEGSYSNPSWKHTIRDHLRRTGAQERAPGPVALAMGFRCTTQGRNWMLLWKPAGDALGPILGEPRAAQPFHPADDRIVELALHLHADVALGWDVELGLSSGDAR